MESAANKSGISSRQKAVRKILREFAHEPFEYGELDCVLFVAKVVEEITGKDVVNAEYNDMDQAAELIVEHGSLLALVESRLGKSSSKINLLDGNPVLLKVPVIGEIMGVIVNGYPICKSKGGALFLDPKYITAGWNI